MTSRIWGLTVVTVCALVAAPLNDAVAVTADDVKCKRCVDRRDLARKAVDKKKLKDQAVTKGKIKDGAVTTEKIRDGAVTEPKIGNGAVTEAKLAPGVMEDLKTGVAGAVAIYDQNGAKMGDVASMVSPSSTQIIVRANGHAGFVSSIGANYISGFTAYYEGLNCSGTMYGYYSEFNLVQYAALAPHPTSGKATIYMPDVDQAADNVAYASTASCSLNWDTVMNQWNPNPCTCTSPDGGVQDMAPMVEAYVAEDRVGPFTGLKP